ncbi:flagellar motor protein MotD [Pseudomaricurvus alcaniphilus]|uniref:flagellar motor protein MotD n=1 Tax=Pseudomaricurvus alcaniphilus TaxID=1166482 RepID=UPI0014098A8C|nr:flagellar motor protein MotD [Pseudomaricurvus alcaniphilus]NHN39403.1 flagellar motor protein MotD [Pseudomaricurvus alcaniphilus]
MPRRRPIEVSVNHERWLISYSDFITLLFAFFVVMYSISQVNESKYRVLSETLSGTFTKVMPALKLDPISIGNPSLASVPSVIDSGGEFDADHTMQGDGAFDKTADLPQLSDLFEQEFADLLDDELLQLHSNELWLEVELKSSVLFDSAEATPTLQARSIFADIAALLGKFDNPVQVEGFTDNVPINNTRYPSNWELSAARATAAVKLLVEGGIAPERLAAVGYGEYRPVADNATVEGRAANRRVVLMIAREKVERPNVQTEAEISRAVEPPAVQASQPYPQPGLSGTSLGADEGALAELLSSEGAGPAAGPGSAGEAVGAGGSAAERLPAAERLAPVGEITPVETQGGGLLFSSDPDLPRN